MLHQGLEDLPQYEMRGAIRRLRRIERAEVRVDPDTQLAAARSGRGCLAKRRGGIADTGFGQEGDDERERGAAARTAQGRVVLPRTGVRQILRRGSSASRSPSPM